MRRLLHILASCIAGFLLVLVLAGYAGGWSQTLEFASAFRLHLALVAGAAGVILAVAKIWRAAGLSLLAALIAAAGLGPILTSPQTPVAQADNQGRPLTVLYANLLFFNSQPQAMGAALRAIDADILITSETTAAVAGAVGQLREHYPFKIVNPTAQVWLRTAIWSKYPLLEGRLHLNNTISPTAASAVADLGGGLRIRLIGAHFSRPNEGLRQVQADALGPIAKELDRTRSGPPGLARPLIIAGDFNAPPWSWLVARAVEVTGARIIGGHRITWKGEYPTPFGPVPALWGHQIDHILLSDGIAVERIETLVLPGSDHLGVLAHLRIPQP